MIAICHDSNHNGDDAPGQGCGNPECWKHTRGNSPKPRQISVPWCQCEFCTTSRLVTHIEINGILQKIANQKDITSSELCPNCSSSDLAKVKGCIRCLKCGFKQDCNGW